MTANPLNDVINAVVQHADAADRVRKQTTALAEDAMEHGWQSLAEGYHVTHTLLDEATTELRTLTGLLRQARQSQQEPDVLEHELGIAASVLEGVRMKIEDALGHAALVGAQPLTEQLHELVGGLQATDEDLASLRDV